MIFRHARRAIPNVDRKLWPFHQEVGRLRETMANRSMNLSSNATSTTVALCSSLLGIALVGGSLIGGIYWKMDKVKMDLGNKLEEDQAMLRNVRAVVC